MGDKLCRLRTLLSATVALGISACTSGESPTGPGIAGDLPPAAPSFALAPNTWSAKAPLPVGLARVAAGMAHNSAGQSIVYVFGGERDGLGTIGGRVLSYNVATNTWTYQRSNVPSRA
jgi:hypothetical protein